MKKHLPLALMAFLAIGAFITTNPSFVLSGTSQITNLMGLGMSGPLAGLVDAQYNTAIATSPTLSSSTLGYRGVQYTITPAATPAAGTNDIRPLSVFPTAAAGASAGLPATVVTGQVYTVCNGGPNAVRVKAYGTPGINGGAAGTYIPLAAAQCVDCVGSSSTNYNCSLGVVPTPAGP